MSSAATADAPLAVAFREVGREDLPLVGGKGANLAALVRAGAKVPPGFCVTTASFDRFIASLPGAKERFAALDALDGTDVDAARAAAESMRRALDALPIPD